MRILTIRGKNLASLAQAFEIQLEDGVLKSSGLFAITGATGAGKSTILDALCLALYDKMPRLPDGHSVFVGHKDEEDSVRVKSNDVSSILRRGTASAYAEVDFLAQDKQSYRARWEITRARGKVNGKLQPQKMTLQNLLTSEKIGEGKKGTLLAIEQFIGLNFDQFRRSVLLAQGDFAAFLKAKKDDRSNLLEKITGTDIYSELSIAAFERAKQEKQALDKITDKLVDKTPLPKQERELLENEKQRISTESTKLQKEIKSTQDTLKWFDTQKTLKQDEANAKRDEQLAQSHWDASQSGRDELQQLEQVQPLRPLFQQSIDLAEELVEADKNFQLNQDSLVEADHKLELIKKQLEQADKNYLETVKQNKAAQPLLQQARQLDTQITSSSEAVDEATKSNQLQKTQWQDAESQLRILQQQNMDKESVKQQSQIWQEQHASIEEVARQWERWENELKGYIENDKLIDQLRNQQRSLEIQLSKDQKGLAETQEKETRLLQEKNDLAEVINELKKKTVQQSSSEIHQQKEQLEQKISQIDKASELASKGLEQRSALKKDKALLLTVEQNIQQINERTPELSIQLQEKQTQLDEAQNAFNLMHAASQKTAKDLRSLLQENEPCPVCGSEQHPWENSELAKTINLPVEEQKKRLTTLNLEKEGLIAEQSQKKSETIQLEIDKQRLSENIHKTESLLSQFAGKWLLIDVTEKPEWPLVDEADITKFNHLNSQLKADYAEVKLLEEQLLAWQKKIDLLRSKFDQLSEKYSKQQQETVESDKQVAKQSADLITLEKDFLRFEELGAESINLLSTPFQSINDWQLQLNQDGNAFLQSIRKDVLKWLETTDELKNIENQLVDIKTKLAVAEAAEAQQQILLQKYSKGLEQAKQTKQGFIAERRKIFQGQSANDFSEQLEQQVQKAETEKHEAESALAAIKIEITRCNSAVAHCQKEQQKCTTKKIASEQKLDQALQKINLDKEALQNLLNKDDQWIELQKNKFKELTVKLQETTAVLNVKNQHLLDHEDNIPDAKEPELHQQINALTEILEKLEQDKENNDFALRSDNEKVTLAKDLQHELQFQTKCWEKWESLNELIGSSSGQKFRIFAQSLTLETLLSYTNSHLQEFAKRYHLQRVPGSDLELQVLDRDMADEVRSVHSLSGGESFLVSLALALGLASLSSNKIQVESLFIDEGFGSLDQETLDIAIASLDTLQSLGRKVGVISHVPVLVERLGAKVVVEKMGGGQSKVSIRSF